MAAEFEEASQSVISTIEDFIQKYHRHLEDCRIACAMRTDQQDEFAKTIKVPPAVAAITEYDILIWVDKLRWEARGQDYRDAIIDHELCHIGLSAGGGYKIKQHDFGDFTGVIERHGLWNLALKDAFLDLAQPRLPGMEGEVEISAAGRVVAMTAEQLAKLAEAT